MLSLLVKRLLSLKCCSGRTLLLTERCFIRIIIPKPLVLTGAEMAACRTARAECVSAARFSEKYSRCECH